MFNSNTTLNFYGDIHATDRADAERAMGDAAWGLQAAQRKRGAS